MIIVTEGAGKAINIMLFIDAHFTDGALVDGYMSAIEAKVKVFHELRLSHMIENGASSDTLLLGLTQQGAKIAGAGSGTVVGKAIGQMVHGAIKECFSKYIEKVH
jgi:iron complex transport system ATP-binding protein